MSLCFGCLALYLVSTQCLDCSFYVVASQFLSYLRSIGKQAELKLNCNSEIEFMDVNLWFSQCRQIDDYDKPNSVLRGDSPYVYLNPSEVSPTNHLLITTSQYNALLFHRFFKHIEVLPHPYDPSLVEYVDSHHVPRDIDFLAIGHNTPDDHKGHAYFRLIKEGRKFLVSNDSDADVAVYKQPREYIYSLYSRSRFLVAMSHTEGFGLPLLEAMVSGVVPIYCDAHAFHEYGMGLPVKCYKVEDAWYSADEKDFLDVVHYAYNMSKEQYDDLSIRVKEYARKRFNPSVILNKLYEFIYKWNRD